MEYSRAKQALEAAATEAYKAELEKKKQGLPWLSSRAICNKFTEENRNKTGKTIELVHTTILCHAEGRPTRAQANETRAWLTTEERKVVVQYIIEAGAQGFPLSHKRLKEHVDEICREKYGDRFPEKGVGKRWTHRFLVKHSNEIMMAWSTQLEDKRGRAVNPNTKAAWDKLLAAVVEKYDISAPQMYAVDETGVTGQTGRKERVMGARKKGLHYQQVGSSWENTTVLLPFVQMVQHFLRPLSSREMHTRQIGMRTILQRLHKYIDIIKISIFDTSIPESATQKKDGLQAKLALNGSKYLINKLMPKPMESGDSSS